LEGGPMSLFEEIVEALSSLPAAKLSGFAPMTPEEQALWSAGYREGVEESNANLKRKMDELKLGR
jgi:hypothetical protein